MGNRGRKPDVQRNLDFIIEWESAKHGTRREVAKKYGMTPGSARVIAHRLRHYGTTSSTATTRNR